ncbi:MAG: hypothetical protein RSB37_01005 [Acetivibrio sp.]
MKNIRKRQMEALEELCIYDKKLLRILPTISRELSEDLQGDTLDLLHQFADGLNWVIEVTNACMELIQENKSKINSKQISNSVEAFECALNKEDLEEIASVMQNGIQFFLEDILDAASQIVRIERK